MLRRLPDLLDATAVGASWLCLAHCLLLPLAAALLPGIAGAVAAPEWVHLAILLTAVPVSLAALRPWHPGHRRGVPMLLAALGCAGLIAGLAFDNRPLAETGLTVLGSLLLATAHIANWCARRLVAA